MKVYNATVHVITLVSNGNRDVLVKPFTFVEVNTTENFNTDEFYVEQEGSWYGKKVDEVLEIYKEN